MKKFHIIFKNNETGEIIHDTDTDAIIGAIHLEEKTACVGLTNCNGAELLSTIRGAKQVIKEMVEENPALSILDMLAKFTENN